MNRSARLLARCLAWCLCAAPLAATAQTYDKNQRLIMPERPTADLGFLEGCWRTDPFRHSPSQPPSISTYCFDAFGKGTMAFRNRIYSCRGLAVTAIVEGRVLKLVDSNGRCTNNIVWTADHLDCVRGADGVAMCSGKSDDKTWTVTLRRQGPPPLPRAPAATPTPATPKGLGGTPDQ